MRYLPVFFWRFGIFEEENYEKHKGKCEDIYEKSHPDFRPGYGEEAEHIDRVCSVLRNSSKPEGIAKHTEEQKGETGRDSLASKHNLLELSNLNFWIILPSLTLCIETWVAWWRLPARDGSVSDYFPDSGKTGAEKANRPQQLEWFGQSKSEKILCYF